MKDVANCELQMIIIINMCRLLQSSNKSSGTPDSVLLDHMVHFIYFSLSSV